ncbi:hypothetical protein BOTNAR_0302g00040 [Botryotinia narcissicola]|uniref:Uncharacterized protein n=1 Tax=Botryotinia narcissicola TaxID=278944 RepID=A0A4Z1HVT6_9HELO|nr:hypothetical protein BOTNAR_0302g00040 [Botryotinia narcissicola]
MFYDANHKTANNPPNASRKVYSRVKSEREIYGQRSRKRQSETNRDKQGNQGNPKFDAEFTSPHIHPAMLRAVTVSVAPTRNWVLGIGYWVSRVDR